MQEWLAIAGNGFVEEGINRGRHVRPLLAVCRSAVPTLHVLVVENSLHPRPTGRRLLQATHHFAGVGGVHPVVPRRRREQYRRQLPARRSSHRDSVVGRDGLQQHVARANLVTRPFADIRDSEAALAFEEKCVTCGNLCPRHALSACLIAEPLILQPPMTISCTTHPTLNPTTITHPHLFTKLTRTTVPSHHTPTHLKVLPVRPVRVAILGHPRGPGQQPVKSSHVQQRYHAYHCPPQLRSL
jgi:hypothetical protein